MVVIEPEEEERKQHPIPPEPKPKTKPAPASSSSSDTAATMDAPPPPPTPATEAAASAAPSAKESGNESEGFETASERGVSDNEEEHDDGEGQQQQQQQQQQQPQQPQSSSNDDVESEPKQRALEKANEAKLEGNKLFGEGKYEEALLQYEAALEQAPPAEDMPASVELRSICHSNRGICFLKLGKYEDTIKECSKALELNPSYLKALVRRGEAHEKLEHFEEAISDMKKILELDPSNDQAKRSICRLEPLAAEKREKMKEEMIGKLKEMGNNILGRFGMSTDNFKAVKDPNTGSYSISFQR